MTRLLMLCYCIIACIFVCNAQEQSPPPHAMLQQLLTKVSPDTADVRILKQAANAFILRPGSLQSDMDSAMLIAQQILKAGIQAKDQAWEANSCLLLSAIYREQSNPKKGKVYIQKAVALFTRLHCTQELAESYVELSHYYSTDIKAELQEKIRNHKLAAKLFAEAGQKRKQAQTLHTLGDYYTLLPDLQEAKVVLLQALSLYQESGVKSLQGVYDLLGVAYNQLGDHNNALKYGLLSVRTAETLKDSSEQLCATYNRLGMTYFDMGHIEESLKYYQKAWHVAVKLKDTISIQILACNFAHSALKINKVESALRLLKDVERRYPPQRLDTKIWVYSSILDCYVMLRELAQVRPYAQQLETLGSTLEREDPMLEHVNGPLIKYYIAVNEYGKARDYAAAMARIAAKQGHLSVLVGSYMYWFKADSALGNFQDALQHYQLYKIYNDSLFSITKSRQINQLQIQFDTEQKDHTLRLKQQNIELLTREGQLQQAALHKAMFTRNVIIIGTVMLVLLLLLGYSQYRLKLRHNHQLKAQQDEINQQNLALQKLISSQHKLLSEKEWLLKEIHHRVKNNLQIVMSLLNTQAAFLHDRDALNAIRESRSRMHTISLIHQKLYQSDNTALIDMPVYIQDLAIILRDTFSGSNRIHLDLQIAPVAMDVSQAVPLGLILNEAITNAMKYAFTGYGTIIVSLQQTGTDQLTLIVADNGKGFTDSEHAPEKRSMGLMLMHMLSEQLEGVLNIESRNGVVVTVRFKHENKPAGTLQVKPEQQMADYV
ncbi:histidine kinase dimerization/phosphoacceptor domain -containing protein [Chitinophaga rhizophila]|uniref:histidine kinase n=1 Tax=Chitinophaga rhizophila TaxID=2866212 RepID=A0ABS7GKI8_9BACT|nr:histidine kinase dimerization/phosphoacceptor domain -containing protein [Chitinophaga rhizophila]MBW8688234.1 tetratricopeptide repeat protein [Chitinophaga rhizophila]